MAGGTVKNISFTNVALSSGSGLTYEGSGTFENVYVKLSIAAIAAYNNCYNVISGGWAGHYTTVFFAKSNTPAEVVMNNVVVDYSETYNATGTTADKYFWGDETFVRALFGNIAKTAKLTNVAVLGANKEKKGSKTEVDSSGFRFNIVCDEAYQWNDGKNAGIYVSYHDDGSTNGVAFPANDWNNSYWTVDASTNSIAWKTK